MSKDREQLIQEFFSNFAILKRQAALNFFQVAGKDWLPPSQSELLHLVNKKQPLNLKELADLMQLTPGAVTQLVDSLVQSGYLKRTNDKSDRRVQLLSLSKKGSEKVSKMKSYHHQRALEMAKVLTDNELQTMHTIQKKMIDYYSNRQKDTGKNTSSLNQVSKLRKVL